MLIYWGSQPDISILFYRKIRAVVSNAQKGYPWEDDIGKSLPEDVRFLQIIDSTEQAE